MIDAHPAADGIPYMQALAERALFKNAVPTQGIVTKRDHATLPGCESARRSVRHPVEQDVDTDRILGVRPRGPTGRSGRAVAARVDGRARTARGDGARTAAYALTREDQR